MIEITIIIMEMMITIGKETEIIGMMDITVPVQDGKKRKLNCHQDPVT